MRIRLNLATSPPENIRRFLAGTALAGGAAAILLIVLAWTSYSSWHSERDHRVRVTQYEARIAELREQRRELQDFFNRREVMQLSERAAFLNHLIEQRSFPWTKIFMDLERIQPVGVRVVSISPKMAGSLVEVRLVIGATSDEAKLNFLRALESSKEFSRIQLMAETRPNASAGGDVVQIELVAWYQTT